MKKYKGYRFPIEIISNAVWCYYRLTASYRDIETLLMQRGIEVSYETIRSWVKNFGTEYANQLRRKQAQRGDKWHLDEQCIMMNGRRYWLWRAVDQDGYELDVLVQPRRNTKAAIRFFRKLLKGLQYVPRVIITDKLRSYSSAKKKILKEVEHRSHKRLNNQIEVAHQPTRLREKQMRKFKSPPQAQRFLSAFGVVKNIFKVGLYKLKATARREKVRDAFTLWTAISLSALVG
jgi:putative transposase